MKFRLKSPEASFFAGVASTAIFGLLVAMTPSPFVEPQEVAIVRGVLDVRGMNHSHAMVRIDGGQSYTVPTGRMFRIRVVVNQHDAARTLTLKFDGVEQNDFVQGPFGYSEFDIGYIASAGAVVSVSVESGDPGYMIGFLEDPAP